MNNYDDLNDPIIEGDKYYTELEAAAIATAAALLVFGGIVAVSVYGKKLIRYVARKTAPEEI